MGFPGKAEFLARYCLLPCFLMTLAKGRSGWWALMWGVGNSKQVWMRCFPTLLGSPSGLLSCVTVWMLAGRFTLGRRCTRGDRVFVFSLWWGKSQNKARHQSGSTAMKTYSQIRCMDLVRKAAQCPSKEEWRNWVQRSLAKPGIQSKCLKQSQFLILLSFGGKCPSHPSTWSSVCQPCDSPWPFDTSEQLWLLNTCDQISSNGEAPLANDKSCSAF
jgi:hypothetical protein